MGMNVFPKRVRILASLDFWPYTHC